MAKDIKKNIFSFVKQISVSVVSIVIALSILDKIRAKKGIEDGKGS